MPNRFKFSKKKSFIDFIPFCLKRVQSAGFTWTLLHFLLFSAAIFILSKAISFDNNHSMASEEISLQIGFTRVAWGLNMICDGNFSLLKNGRITGEGTFESSDVISAKGGMENG